MLLAHYAHRLPADYDLQVIRERARRRGPLWDAVPELYFKAFLLREARAGGPLSHDYSSLYLWRSDKAFSDFLLQGRYRTVTDAFGRAQIQTRFVLDARRGPADHARFVLKEEVDVPLDSDLSASFSVEVERSRERASRPDVVASVIGVDVRNWRITRTLLSVSDADATSTRIAYEVLHLAQPLLDELPRSDDE